MRTRTKLAVGPVQSPSLSGMDWKGSFWEVGAEVHALLVGGHVYVDAMGIADFLTGFILIDPQKDDFYWVF